MPCTRYAPVHAVVKCEDCPWTTGSYKNAQALAAQHSERYGHKVTGELGIYFTYEPLGE